MDLNLKGKRALVTGSTAGIGAEIARVLAAEGASVVIHGRNAERARKFAAELGTAGSPVAVTLGELTQDGEAERVAREAESAFGGIDILINNAGSYPITSWWDTPAEVWLGFKRQPSRPPTSGAQADDGAHPGLSRQDQPVPAKLTT